MKTLSTLIIAAALMILSPAFSFAQCTIDQTFTGTDTRTIPIDTNVNMADGQSFNPTVSGYLSSVGLDLSASNQGCNLTTMNIRIDILEGDTIRGNALASEVFTRPIDFARVLDTFNFSMPAYLHDTMMYTIAVTLVPGQDCGGGAIPSLDWHFAFPTNFWSATGGIQYVKGNIASLGNTQYFFTCMSNCAPNASTISPSACFSYTTPSGNNTYTMSGTYTDTVMNAGGCDSVITINLNIDTVDKAVTNAAPMLTANATGASYQWLDCDNNYAIMTGDTNQSLTATANGSYAVEVTQNTCVDTSDCEVVANVSIIENSFKSSLVVFPNPTKGQLSIDLAKVYSDLTVVVRNTVGQEIARTIYSSSSVIDLNIEAESGIYFIELSSSENNAVLRVIKD